MDLGWLEQNVEAHRILADMLCELRAAVRRRLQEIYGSSWPDQGIPATVMERLITKKELERMIDWYEGEYQELTDYATFVDLLEILQLSPEALPGVLRFGPNPDLVHARFTELEAMRSKVAMCRPIGETELGFLGTVQRRLRSALAAEVKSETSVEEEIEIEAPYEVTSETEDLEPAPETESESQDEVEPEAMAQSLPEVPKTTEDEAPTESAPPVTAPLVSASNHLAGPLPKVIDPIPDFGTQPMVLVTDDDPDGQQSSPVSHSLRGALELGQNKSILRQLHQEVTAIAQTLWTSNEPPNAELWFEVLHSRWFAEQGETLELDALTHYYAFIARLGERIRSGLSSDEREEILKSPDFAKHLLALREMFSKHGL